MRSELVALGEVCDITMGQAPKGDTYNDDGVGWPLIAGAGDFGELHPAIRKFTTAADARLCEPGDFVLGIRASIGEKVLADAVYCLGRGVAGLRPRPALHDRWLWHWISYASHELAQRGRGATFKQVNKSDVNSWKIPLPPIDEQRRIAAVLDAAEALRTKRGQALARLDDLPRAVFHDMFGEPSIDSAWPKVCLLDVCRSKGEYGANVPAADFDGRKPRYLRITDIRSDGTLTDEAVGPGGTEGQWRSKMLNPGDILFARSGATVGKAFLVRDEDPPLVFAGYLIRFAPDQKRILPEFMYQCTKTEKYRNWVATAATTVAQPNINASKYGQLELLLPPMELQRQFVSAVERIRRHRTALGASSRALDTLFASLQQRAFRGEL